VVGVTVLCCGSCAACCIVGKVKNDTWLKKHKVGQEEVAKIAKTKKGNVEYSIKGNAPYVLCLHGTPGLHDGVTDFFGDWVQ